MPTRRKMLLIISLTSSTVFAQQSSSPSTNYFPAHRIGVHQNTLQMMAMEPMPMVAPLFLEEDKITSSLILVNSSVVNAGVTISVREPEGKESAHRHVVLSPHEQQRFAIATLLTDSHPLTMGSISVTRDRNVKGMSVAGQLLITNHMGATPTYVDEELVTPSEQGSPVLRAVTDEAQGSALLAITNTGNATEEVTVQCLGEQRHTQPASLKIAPWATSITGGCSGRAVADFDYHVQALEKASSHEVQGFEITGSRESGRAGRVCAGATSAQ